MKRSHSLEDLKVYGELLSGVDFYVVTVHPLSDELVHPLNDESHLESVDIHDLYWYFKDKLFFVSVYYDTNQKPKISYYIKKYSSNGHTFNIITNHKRIDRHFINTLLLSLSKWVENNHKSLNSKERQNIAINNLGLESLL